MKNKSKGGKVLLKRNYIRRIPNNLVLNRNAIPLPILSSQAPAVPINPEPIITERRPINPEPLTEQEVNELFFGSPNRRGGRKTRKTKKNKKSLKNKSRKHRK